MAHAYHPDTTVQDNVDFLAAMMKMRETGHALPAEHSRLDGMASRYFSKRGDQMTIWEQVAR